MKKRMIIVTALIMGTLGAECVSVQASDTLPELTKDNARNDDESRRNRQSCKQS